MFTGLPVERLDMRTDATGNSGTTVCSPAEIVETFGEVRVIGGKVFQRVKISKMVGCPSSPRRREELGETWRDCETKQDFNLLPD
jgi:hypothetical protein